MLIGVYLVYGSSNEDAFSLRHTLWFHYEINLHVFLLICSNLILKSNHFIRQKPSLRKELIVFWKLFFHLLKVPSKVSFSWRFETFLGNG